MLNLQGIIKAKHIVIVLAENTSIDELCSANALYTYLLQLHKKVSLYIPRADFAQNLSFLPWIDKVKTSYPASSDCEIKAFSSQELFKYFKSNKIDLNVKMATSLYAGIIAATKGFSKALDGTIFAMAEVLLQKNADVKLCNEHMLNYHSLASLRLKAILLSKMQLQENGSKAVFHLTDEDLKKSGATELDAGQALLDALGLPTVKFAVLLYKNKIIMKEEIN